MRKDVLQSIRELERIHVSEAELNVRIHDEFGEA
jgi:hypothetical protein